MKNASSTDTAKAELEAAKKKFAIAAKATQRTLRTHLRSVKRFNNAYNELERAKRKVKHGC